MIKLSPSFTNKLFTYLSKYWLALFYILTIIYYELIYFIWHLKLLNTDFIFPVLFSIPYGIFIFIITFCIPVRIQKPASIIFTVIGMFYFFVQFIYYDIFHVPLFLYSLTGASDAMQFKDIAISSIFHNYYLLILLSLPVIFLILNKKNYYSKVKIRPLLMLTGIGILTYLLAIVCIEFTGDSPVSQKSQFNKMTSIELSVNKLGMLTTFGLDFKHLIMSNINASTIENESEMTLSSLDKIEVINIIQRKENLILDDLIKTNDSTTKPAQKVLTPFDIYNIMDIDFNKLAANAGNNTLTNMDRYFSTVQPTKKNKYTGLFKGYNLIFITAESFSSYVVDETLTPTLYEMVNSGFKFNNFYNPIWEVSTTDGEYVACTGLIPKSGVWSLSRSYKNYLPFVMGNQFKSLGYLTKAYHDHTYTYYKRNLSHPNMGYDYKAVGNGLNIQDTWPESDIEMMEVTSQEFISEEPFHVYFMTVSGHLQYNFYGNYISRKNEDLVKDLPYSDASRAYLAANLEFEKALELLIQKLNDAGILDKTVFVISPDHYPYGLSMDNINELAGHKVENNFELYKSTLIIWKKGMTPVEINKPCSSLDIIPTISNLFGLEFDSRLLMGHDILSDSTPLVIFSNRSWITDRAKYNSMTNKATFTDGTENDEDYIKLINQTVDNKFKYSAKVLDYDYYTHIFSTN